MNTRQIRTDMHNKVNNLLRGAELFMSRADGLPPEDDDVGDYYYHRAFEAISSARVWESMIPYVKE